MTTHAAPSPAPPPRPTPPSPDTDVSALPLFAPPVPASLDDEILRGLNAEQREAVTHGEGPLLIVAGAGTGKTQVITRRIAWLIATKRARPEEVLALTFTDKAAAEMESRVDILVPYGFVGATISTFHAFCDRLVREHAVELGLTSQLRVETPAEILVFLRERILELPLRRYRPLGNPDEHLQALVRVFDRARDEDVSPEAYVAFAERLGAEAGDDPERRDRAEAELEKALAYARYQQLLHEHGRVDFGAQISLALRLLRERPYIRRELQDRFRYVLVDEFQDTNHVQFELVRLLAGERRNLTVVGDDDQSIYRFRGAKVENLLGFLEAFPDVRTLVLKRNYRSGQRILDVAHRLVSWNNPGRLEVRGGFDKRLVADREIEAVVEARSFATASDEADGVAAEIAASIERGERSPGDIAVLARAHSSLDPFATALKAQGVRFRRVGMRGLYSRPEVILCLNVLRSVAFPDEGAPVHFALGDPLFGADPVDLATLGSRARRFNRPLREVAAQAADGNTVTPATEEAVSRFLDLHRRLCASALRRPASEVLYEFVTDSGLLGRLAAEESPSALEQVQNLNKLFRMVARVGPLLTQDRVEPFIRHLDLLIEMGDDPSAADVEVDENTVNLLTAHNAKGLEFDVVYLVHLVQGRFPRISRYESLELPEELRHGDADAQEEPLREERRLFYVGMTRARDRLVLTHATDYGGLRPHKPSQFLFEALDVSARPRSGARTSAMESIARYAPAAEPTAPGVLPIPDDEPLALSNERIDDYVTCPLKYRYAHVAQVPLATDPTFMYGIAIHHAIRVYLQHRMKRHPIDVADVIAAFEGAWSSEGFYSREHEELRLEQGRDTLRRFVAREQASQRLPLAVEREFKFKLSRNDIVVGRWDRIDEREDGIVLVDYKTSEVESPEKAMKNAQESVRDAQLGLYALAYFETTQRLPARVELQYVGAGLTGGAPVFRDHIERARTRASAAAAGIRRADFHPTPNPRSCSYCPYSRFCIHSATRSTG